MCKNGSLKSALLAGAVLVAIACIDGGAIAQSSMKSDQAPAQPFPARQSLRNLAVLPERDCQDDRVGLECFPQRLGDDRGSNRPSLRRQRLGRPAARDGHVDVFAGGGVGEGLA